MTGYTTDPGELAAAAAHVRDTADALTDARLDPSLAAHLGPGRLAAAAAALTADTQATLDTTAGVLSQVGDVLTAARLRYRDTDEESARLFGRTHP